MIRQGDLARNFASQICCENAGILCVFQGFRSGFVGEKNRQSPQTQLCGVAFNFTAFYRKRPMPIFAVGYINYGIQGEGPAGTPKFRGPGEAQRQRVRRGEEEQRNERAFALKAKREIWSLRRRGHNTPQNGQITFQTFPGKWGKIATAGRGSPRGEAERKVLWALGAGRSNVSRKQGRRACILLPKLRQSPDIVSPKCEQSPHIVLAEFPQSLCRACAEFAQSFTKVCWKLGQVC